MAEDSKFAFIDGKFVNHVSGEAIPDDEPVMLFRARDWHALATIQRYRFLIENPRHAQAVDERIAEFEAFKAAHPERMKEPGITGDFRLKGE